MMYFHLMPPMLTESVLYFGLPINQLLLLSFDEDVCILVSNDFEHNSKQLFVCSQS